MRACAYKSLQGFTNPALFTPANHKHPELDLDLDVESGSLGLRLTELQLMSSDATQRTECSRKICTLGDHTRRLAAAFPNPGFGIIETRGFLIKEITDHTDPGICVPPESTREA